MLRFTQLHKLLFQAFSDSSATRLTQTVQRLAIAGTAASLALILLGSSIVEGFQWEIPQRMGQFWGHLQVRSLRQGEATVVSPLRINQERLNHFQKLPGVQRVSAVVLAPGLGRSADGMEGILLKGVNNQDDLKFYQAQLSSGQIPKWGPCEVTNEILIPQSVASALRVRTGDDLSFYFMQQPVRMRKFRVIGIFEMPMQNELGRPVAVVHQSILRKLMGWSATAGGHLELELDDHRKMLLVRNEVEKLLSVEEECLTLEEQMPALFEWLRFFDTNRMVLMILLVGVGAVNLLSALFILILERQQSIGILQTLGLRPAQLSQTLVFLGMRLVIKGMLIGNLGMGLIYMAQNRWKFFRLDPESYYLDFVPLKLDIPTWFMINGGAMAIAFFLLWISAFLLTRRYSDQNLQFT